MRISIFTPTNNPEYLQETYNSIKDQNFYEWIILGNGSFTPLNFGDSRVKVYYDTTGNPNVGYLKHKACTLATGDYLLELDHDDLLTENAMQEICNAIEYAGNPDFLYSNKVNFNNEYKPVNIYDKKYGWEYRDFEYKGYKLKEAISSDPSPSNFSRIWFAPDHVRVWKKEFYDKIGGHNPDMKIADDHDLICRTYIHGSIYHIDKPLYMYRIHGDNTWLANQEDIQIKMWENHDKYYYAMCDKWARDKGLPMYDLGGGINPYPGYKSVDLYGGDIEADLTKKWPFADNSVGVFRAHDLVEHLPDAIHTMNEAHRCLVHGGMFNILVPSSNGEGAFCDPTHVSFWNKRSFRYYTEANMRRFIEPMCTAKFQIVKLEEIRMWDNLPYIQAHLLAIKDGERFYGSLDF